jgi:hypothetical protein
VGRPCPSLCPCSVVIDTGVFCGMLILQGERQPVCARAALLQRVEFLGSAEAARHLASFHNSE